MRKFLWGSLLLMLVLGSACDRQHDQTLLQQPLEAPPEVPTEVETEDTAEVSAEATTADPVTPDLVSADPVSADPVVVDSTATESTAGEAPAAETTAVQQIQQEAYAQALERLKLTAEQSPESAPILQKLIQNPEQAAKLFDTCPHDWVDLEPPADQPREVWEAEQARFFYQDFPDLVESTQVYPISDQKSLVVMVCVRGPYWVATTNSIYDETGTTPQLKPLVLPTFDQDSQQVIPSESALNTGFQSYDTESQQLNLMHRYRGVGDCGMQAIYQLEGDAFVLQEFYEQAECDGSRSPGDFPKLYPRS